MSNSEAREYIDFALKQRKDNQPSNTFQVKTFRSESPRTFFQNGFQEGGQSDGNHSSDSQPSSSNNTGRKGGPTLD